MSSSAHGAADQALRQKFTEAPVKVAVTTSASAAQMLALGRHRIVADADVFVLQGDSTVAPAATANAHLLPKGAIDYLTVSDDDDKYVSALTASGTATLELMQQR